MAVKIDQLNDLEELSAKMKQYKESLDSTSSAAQVSFDNKLQGAEGAAVEQFNGVMNELKSAVFSNFPTYVSQFSQAVSKYHSALNGAGFSSKIKSSKPVVEEDYCQKLKATVLPEMEQEGLAIKAIINEISAVLDTVEPSKIESEFTEASNSINNQITAMKTTRSTVQEAQKALKNELKSVQSGLSKCLNEMDNIMGFVDPRSGLSSKSAIALIRSGVLTGESASTFAKNGSKEDFRALDCLGKGDYEQLFEVDPNKLSQGTYSVLVAHANKQIGEDNTAELQLFINGLLGQIGSGSTQRVDTYLEKLSSETSLQMKQIADLQIMMYGITGSDADKLAEKYQTLQIGNMFWEALYVLKPNREQNANSMRGGATFDIFSEIGKININRGENPYVTFGLTSYQVLRDTNAPNTSSIPKGDKKHTLNKEVKEVSSTHFNSKDDLNKAENQVRLNEILKKQSEYIQEIAKAGLLFTIGIFSPGVATGIGVVEEIAKGSNTSTARGTSKGSKEVISNLDKYIAEKYPDQYKSLKKPIGWGFDFIGKGIDLWEGSEKLSTQERAAKISVLYDILDIGGSHIDVDGTGTINLSHDLTYKQQMRMIELTEHGYTSFFASIPAEDAFDIKSQLAKYDDINDIWIPKTAEANFILNGGDPTTVNMGTIEKTLKQSMSKASNMTGKEIYEKYWGDSEQGTGASHWFKESNQENIFNYKPTVNAP